MSAHREPEWTTETIKRTADSTTLEQCGWCQHMNGSVGRYGCNLEGRCGLLKSYGPTVYFDTPCILKRMGKSDVESAIKSKRDEIETEHLRIGRLETQIKTLEAMVFDDMPPLPENRHWEHFNLGDEIMLYVDETVDFKPTVSEGWYHGVVISGYRHHDGCVSARIDVAYHDNLKFEDGHGAGLGTAVPTIMLKSEYDWFADHPARFKDWIRLACSKQFNGEVMDADAILVPTIG